ncbi:SRPBCC family protein [Reichenbachiella versicolor]|uniref:SRPBCC family protein n=1 Tax=Reichenbachiella versicolor TaxID=1821036 RepID=UPI000D6E4B91|nr:GyrI-like domain-containing protein [Reichenbachiella versicolor]
MPKMHVSRSVTICKTVTEVFTKLNKFHDWKSWSPWLIQEPEAESSVSEDGKFHSWDGNRIGVGNMLIVDEKENEYVDYDLTFVKPWKSKAKVRFELDSRGDDTEVTWIMDSSLPIFMFWMKGMMEALVGMDYERGLAMLKDFVEDGEAHTKLDFQGNSQFQGFKYIGIEANTTKSEVGSSMKKVFGDLMSFAESNKNNIEGDPFTIYHKWDMIKGDIEYTSGIPVKELPLDLPEGFITGEVPATHVYSIKHTGPYEHLGNAWSTLYNMQQSKVFKTNKKIHPFEVYTNDPSEVDSNQLETVVYFAVK